MVEKPYRVGFTGTRHGMTPIQKLVLQTLLQEQFKGGAIQPVFHHGDCVGADAEAAAIALDIGYKLECHPPLSNSHRAYVVSSVYHPPRPYLDRDRDIVVASEVLFVTPFQKKHVIRSGTWTTYRYGQRLKRHTYIIYPDGIVEESNG